MMKYAIVYSSRTGNTRLLADTLHTTLPPKTAFISARLPPKPWLPTGVCGILD